MYNEGMKTKRIESKVLIFKTQSALCSSFIRHDPFHSEVMIGAYSATLIDYKFDSDSFESARSNAASLLSRLAVTMGGAVACWVVLALTVYAIL